MILDECGDRLLSLFSGSSVAKRLLFGVVDTRIIIPRVFVAEKEDLLLALVASFKNADGPVVLLLFDRTITTNGVWLDIVLKLDRPVCHTHVALSA